MATYTTPLRIKLLADGEEPVVWGQSTNTNLSTVLETAITGVKTISTGDVNYTLTANNALPDDARNAVLVFTGARTAIRTITAPNINKTYTIKNSTTGGFGITISAGSGTTVTIPNGATTQVYCDGSTGFYVVSSTIPITNVAMNSLKLTGLAVGTTTGDSVEYSQLALKANLAGDTFTGDIQTTGLGIDTAPVAENRITLGNITGGTNARGISSPANIQSDVTVSAASFQSAVGTQAAAFTCASLYHFSATQATLGAGSAITNQYGFFAQSTLTGATNNYGFLSNIDAATGRYNFYASGTANNYFAGIVTCGSAINSASPTGGIGYTTGAGGAVTQATSKATGVTLSKVCGTITTHAASLAANTAVSFVLTNTVLAATDNMILNIVGGTNGAYCLGLDAVAAGSCTITLRNLTAGAIAEAVKIRFTILNSVNS